MRCTRASFWSAVVALVVPGMALAWSTVLVVETDVPCADFLDGRFAGRSEPGTPLEVELAEEGILREAGVHDLEAVSLEIANARWQGLASLFEGRRETVEVALRHELDRWRDVDPEDRPPLEERSRLEDAFDGTVRDPESGLEWRREDNGRDITWEEARAYCDALAAGSGSDRSWRLPTIEELERLVDRECRGEYRISKPIVLNGCCPWSSSEHSSVSSWYMGFDTGERGFVNREYNEGGRALCVR